MSNVYTTSLGVPKRARNKRNYGDGFYNATTVQSSVNNLGTKTVPTDIIEFTASARPTVSDYNTLYAPLHGQFPRLECIIDNGDGTRYQQQQMPQFTTLTSGGGLDDLIDTVFWDIGEGNEVSGWIIIN